MGAMFHKVKNDEKGFAVLESVLIVVIVAALVGVGAYVWHAQKQTNATLNAASKSAQSSPEKSAARKKTAQSSDETASWLLYESPGKKYTIRLADGWKLQRYQNSDSLYTFDSKDLIPVPGTKAVVTSVEGGRDGTAVGLFISYIDGGGTTNYKNPLPSFSTNDGVEVSVYTEVGTSETDGLGGLPPGATGYQYIVKSAGSAFVQVTYGFNASDTDYHTTVEKVLKTLHFN
jgi:Tfp pilus assembly protein PilE